MESTVDYSLQEPINELKIPSTLTVVGTGGSGSWVALFAALAGVKKLILFDPGNVDGKDVAREPFTVKQIGMSKVTALRDLILERRPEVEIKTFERGFDLEKDDELVEGIVFQGASNQKVAQGLETLAKKKNLQFIMGLYSKLDAYTSNFLPSTCDINDKEIPVWVGATALSGILSIYSAFVKPLNFGGSIHSLNMEENELTKLVASVQPQP